MSSNNDSPSTISAKRPNKAKKNAVEYQERVLSKVREMFDSILEPDVILSVVQNCNWKLQPSIEHLITLSASVDSPTESNGNMGSCSEDFGENESTSMDNLGSSQEDDAFEVDTDFTYLNIDDEELQKQKDGFRKFELMRKQSQDFSQGNSPSRLSVNTCAINESPLETIEDEDTKSKEENIKIDTINDIPDTSNIEKWTKNSCLESASRDLTYPVFSADEKNSKENLLTCNQNQLPAFNLHGSSQEALKSLHQAPTQVYNIKSEERRKAETESLCGLKVQYRFGGQETSSDDDADVVIEEESSDYNIPNTQTNVCQFLSLSTQSPLKTTKPQVEMINTPSPFSSPTNKHKFKANYQSTLSRIKSTIQRGFKIMVLLRGLPGSGKSYLARDIVRSTVGGDFSQYIFSTDDFFSRNERGIFKFDSAKLSEAHTYNQERVLKALREERSPIIVDNTNTQCWEMKVYVAMAVQYGYLIEVLEPETPWASNLNQLEKRNVHSVSRETLQRMLDRFERNITGAKLLRIFHFSYDPYNMPPQSCSSLPSPSKSKRASPTDSNKTKNSNKSSKPVENLEDYVPSGFANARVVDAIPNPSNENLTALQLAMKTFGGDDDDDDNGRDDDDDDNGGDDDDDDNLSPKENDQDLIEDKWEDDGISWEDEMLSVEIKKKNSKAFKETLNEDSTCMDDKVLNVNTEADKATYLNLGAIGSERKNVKSLVDYDSDNSDQNENVLSQCWDFTLMLDGRQIHSVGPLSGSENADQEKEDENSSEISSNSALSENPMVVDSSSKSENPVKSDDSEKSKSPSADSKEAQNTLDDKGSPDSGPKSFNTESFEHIDSNSEDFSLDIHEAIDTREIVESSMDCLISSEEVEKDSGTSNTDPQAKVSFGSIMKFIKKSFLGANNDECKAKKVEEVVVKYDLQNPKSHETVMDTLTEKLHSPIKEQNPTIKLNYEVGVNISESTMNDTLSKKLSNIAPESNDGNSNLACEPQGTFESTGFFQEELTTLEVDVITNRDGTFEHYCSLKKNSSENQSFISAFEAEKVNLIQETSPLENINSLNDLNFVLPLPQESENRLEVSMIRPAKIKLTGPLARAVLSLDENERLILEEKKLMKSETNNFEEKHVKTKKFDDKSIQYFETIDNINSITWKETPFPACEIELSVKAEEPKNVATSEASTNTNFYDFNVSYIGGTSESEYKLLNTVSRSINEGLILSNLETPPPQKLKLDKSSMTNEVDILLELPSISGEIEETEKNVIQGLFDMFPHISRDYVVDVYKNVCKSDSHWAIDVLLDATPSEEILNAQPLKFPIIEDSHLHSSAFRNKRAEKMKQSGSLDFNESDSNSQGRKKEKNQVSEDSLALKRHLEEKVMINMASYHPHILRVKKWKNREPDVPTEEIIEAQARNKDVIQFLSDLNPVEVASAESLINSEHLPEEKEESDGEDSSETEETIEFSLGWEFIQNLEKEFGDPNFQFPDGLFPVIQVKKSLAEQIHALWMESMQQQIETQQEYLDSMIAKDAEYAKSLEAEEAKALKDSTAPNLSEVMDMEYALAVYKNDLKKHKIRETPLDMASRLTRQMLNEMFPDYNPETLSEILEAHNGNFKETVKNLEANTGQSFSFLNKQNNLMAKVKQQSLVKEDEASVESSLTSAEVDEMSYDQLTYDEALQTASESKDEVKRQLLLRSENFDKAYAAYRRGNPAVAAYYSEMAKLHSKKMEKANRDAVEAFIAIQTHGSNEGNTLDLHNLFVPEALQALDIFLNHQLTLLSRGSKKTVEIFVITGRGARSNNKKSKIKPAVSRRLASRNISFTETNPGCLKVKLHRYNIAST